MMGMFLVEGGMEQQGYGNANNTYGYRFQSQKL